MPVNVIIPGTPTQELRRAFNIPVTQGIERIVNPYIFAGRPSIPQNKSNQFDGKIDQTTFADQELYKSDLGTTVFADVTFDSVDYTDNQGKSVSTPKMTFQSILITASFPRNIVKTEIQGRNGTVKEYIGEGDAQIMFRGVIVGQNGAYPYDAVALLKMIITAPVTIPVICQYLQNLDVHAVVFEDREFSQEEGGYSYQTFTLNAVADTPQELKINSI